MTLTLLTAQSIFKQQGGLLSTTETIRLGISPRTLYALRDSGALTEIARGLYRLASLPPFSQPDLVTVALRIPKGVIGLISALAFHELTTQIPHSVHVTLPYSTSVPHLLYPPLTLYWVSGKAFMAGVETQMIDGIPVRMTNPEKTVADCFKFRNKLGLEVAIEALKELSQRKKFRREQLIDYARLDRVGRILQPYLEMVT